MAVKTFYWKNAVPAGATLHRSLQDGGTAPTTATTTTGWIPATNVIGQSCLMVGGTEVARNAATWGATLQPSAAPSTTLGDCWRSENAISGVFANANWSFAMASRSVTAAYTGRVRLAIRLYRSPNANGSAAVEMTSGRVVSTASAANMSLTVDTTFSWSWTPAATHTLNNEYLFAQVGVEVTAAGGGTTQDMDFRVGTGLTLTTPNFSPLHVATGDLDGDGATIDGSADRSTPLVNHDATGTLIGDDATIAGSASRFRAHAGVADLDGAGATTAGAARRFRAHSTTGTLTGSTSTLSGSAARTAAPAGGTHVATGALTGSASTLAGTARRFRAHVASGIPKGAGATMAGVSRRFRAHVATGVLTGSASTITGVSRRFRAHAASGIPKGAGSTLAGVSRRFRAHAASGIPKGAGSTITGVSRRFRAHAASGIPKGAGSTLAGVSRRFRSHTATGIPQGAGGAFSGVSRRFRTHPTTGTLTGTTSTLVGTATRVPVAHPIHTASAALFGAGSILSAVAHRADVFVPQPPTELIPLPDGALVYSELPAPQIIVEEDCPVVIGGHDASASSVLDVPSVIVLDAEPTSTVIVETPTEGFVLGHGSQGPPGIPGSSSQEDLSELIDEVAALTIVVDHLVATASFIFTQNAPLAIWPITHSLGRYPAVTVVDSALTQIEGTVTFVNLNQLTLVFSVPFAGQAFLS